jgi:hypothetical protein
MCAKSKGKAHHLSVDSMLKSLIDNKRLRVKYIKTLVVKSGQVLKVPSQVRHLVGIPKVVREMEFLEFVNLFSEFFKAGNMFGMDLKIAKISIFEKVYRKISNVKFGMEKKFSEKISKVVFHRF